MVCRYENPGHSEIDPAGLSLALVPQSCRCLLLTKILISLFLSLIDKLLYSGLSRFLPDHYECLRVAFSLCNDCLAALSLYISSCTIHSLEQSGSIMLKRARSEGPEDFECPSSINESIKFKLLLPPLVRVFRRWRPRLAPRV